jgi:hypothetical protein
LEMGSCELFDLGWPRTVILPISASQVVKVTDMSHVCPACFSYFWERVLCFAQQSSYLCFLHSWDDNRCASPCLVYLLGWVGGGGSR